MKTRNLVLAVGAVLSFSTLSYGSGITVANGLTPSERVSKSIETLDSMDQSTLTQDNQVKVLKSINLLRGVKLAQTFSGKSRPVVHSQGVGSGGTIKDCIPANELQVSPIVLV
jgi:hypothetical protein